MQLKYALTYVIQVIGEAANQISKETQITYPQLPWSAMVGMRNILVHQYFAVDTDQLWDTVQKHLPPLQEKLKIILAE